jgi:hypothetical protein
VGGGNIHQCAAHVADGDDAFLFAFHGLGKEGKGFADLGFFFGRQVVLFGEFGGARAGGFGG